MKLGVLTNVVGNMPLEDALKYFKSMGKIGRAHV